MTREQMLEEALRVALPTLAAEVTRPPDRAAPVNAVRATRDRLGLSQAKFARLLGTSVATLQGWENRRRAPPPLVGVVCDMIARAPDWVAGMLEILAQEREAASRLPDTATCVDNSNGEV